VLRSAWKQKWQKNSPIVWEMSDIAIVGWTRVEVATEELMKSLGSFWIVGGLLGGFVFSCGEVKNFSQFEVVLVWEQFVFGWWQNVLVDFDTILWLVVASWVLSMFSWTIVGIYMDKCNFITIIQDKSVHRTSKLFRCRLSVQRLNFGLFQLFVVHLSQLLIFPGYLCQI
jgi:hypothetical protein